MADRSAGAGRPGRREGVAPVVVGLLGVLLFAGLWWHLERADRQALSKEARITADRVQHRLEAWVDVRVAALRFLAVSGEASGAGDEAAFRRRAAHLTRLHPGFQAVNWVDADTVIRIVHPAEGNEAALGQSLRLHPAPGVAAALSRAVAARRIARTPSIELLQGGRGIATYVPVYDEADGELVGYVNGVLRIEALVNACLAEARLQRDYRYVLMEEDATVAHTHGVPRRVARSAHRADAVVRAVDRPWHLFMAPSEIRLLEAGSSTPLVVFVSGLLGTGLIVWLLLGRRVRSAALRQSEALYRSLISDVLDTFRVGIIILDADRKVVWLNEAFSSYFGLAAPELLGVDIRGIAKERASGGLVENPETFIRHVFATGDPEAHAFEFRVVPGRRRKERWLEHHSQTIESGLFAGGRIDQFYDVTARKTAAAEQSRLLKRERELQDQLRQAQRIDAVGKLAGGVAHDFNNILQVILGRAHQVRASLPEQSPIAESMVEIIEASQKAAGLTRQLLAFGRRQHLQQDVLDPNRLVRDHVKMLRRLIGRDIELDLELGDDVGRVRVDPTQLEQVLMNLCVNARDAMPNGGRITITTEACRQVEAPLAKTPSPHPPESFVKLSVTDTGTGISAANLDRVCEPFFSTKKPGQGSGLGLSTAYGIVRQHGGFLEIESVVGIGTTILVYLPSTDEADRPHEEARTDSVTKGTETILLVEDDPGVRGLALESLKDAGYQVQTATDGMDGLEKFLASSRSIDLLLSDVVMPNMGGVALVKAVRRRGFDVRILLTSGHGEDAAFAGLQASFIEKPYAPSQLLQRVREVLDA